MSHTATLHTEFLQSPLWGEVQKSSGRRVFYIKNCLIIKHTLPFGKSWLYSPRPNIKSKEVFAEIAREAAQIARKENAIFWKIEGLSKNFQIFNFQFSNNFQLSVRKSTPLQYPETFLIDLTQSEDALLKNMKQKTRYNINLAQKKGITVEWSIAEKFSIFYTLLKKTAERQNIKIHSEKHYRAISETLGKENAAALAIAYYEDKPIAANMVIFYGDTAAYLHGGTDHAHHNLMAPYLLQWETMREARRRGLRWYDLGGAAVTRGKIKEWEGITRFKEGFGGELTVMGETYDVVFSREWYWLYKQGNRLKTLTYFNFYLIDIRRVCKKMEARTGLAPM